MAENNGICLIGVMDRLWFEHIILFQEHHSLCVSETTPKNDMSESESESFAYSSTNNSQTTLLASEDDEISSAEDAIITTTPFSPQDEINNENIKKLETTSNERPTRLTTTLLANKTMIRSHSSSPSIQKRSKISQSPGTTLFQKTMSCRSLCELEAEELKGFMDLGFTFNKQHLNKRIISVVPGLQRLETDDNINDDVKIEVEECDDDVDDVDDEEEEREKDLGCVGYQRSSSVNCVPTSSRKKEREVVTMRPYLSEAWLIKRPDSPLLNMRVPRASAAADMKKHLKYWARTVASVIQQES